MIIEGGIAAERGHDRRVRRYDEAGDLAEQPVYATADRDIVAGNAVVKRQRLAQLEILRIAVHPGRFGRCAHRFQHGGGGTEATFVRADAGAHGKAAVALDGLGSDEGNRGGQGLGEGGEAGECGHDGAWQG